MLRYIKTKSNFNLRLMRNLNLSVRRLALVVAVLMSAVSMATGQNLIPEMNSQPTLEDQLKYVEEHTRIYENFRAIREDMFQRMKSNILDSSSASKKKIISLNKQHNSINNSYESLRDSLETTKIQLAEVTNTKESIRFIGMEVNKRTYNSIMWTLVFGLIIIMLIGYLLFNRNRIVTVNTKKDLEDLKKEFETYRKTTREAREKADMAHFNEIQKLRGRS